MIVDEHVRAYINSLNPQERPLLHELQVQAQRGHVPIIREEMRELLRFFVTMHKPMRILEIGTAIGYSAIVMHECQPQGGSITTIERNEKRYKTAVENIKKAGMQDAVQICFGDALQVLEELTDDYDMIFTDAAKGQYQNFFSLCEQHLRPGGLLICDNVLQEGTIARSRYAITRRDHTIHGRMREFLYMLKNHPAFQTTVLPLGDGVTVSYKYERKVDK